MTTSHETTDEKAQRLYLSGAVRIIRENDHIVLAWVDGDHDTYQTVFSSTGFYSCTCPHGTFYSFTTCMCSHAKAVQLYMLEKGETK